MGYPGESLHQILKRPLITERTAILGSIANAVTFEVHPKANKNEIKRAVEKLFDVKVKAVRTMNNHGKVKRVKNRIGRQSDWKKAYVLLEKGQTIDLIEGT